MVIVATVSAIYGIGDPSEYHGMILHLRQGERMSQRDVLARLVAMQYQRSELDFRRGTFRVRGDVIDVFPAEHAEQAIRISWTTMRSRSWSLRSAHRPGASPDGALHGLPVEPLRDAARHHAARDRGDQGRAAQRIEFFQKAGRLVEAQRIEQRTRFDLEMLAELGFCKGIENYSRHLSAGAGRAAADAHRLPAAGRAHDHRREPRHDPAARRHVPRRSLAQGEPGRVRLRLPSALDNRPLRFDEFEKVVRQTIFVSATPAEYEREKSGAAIVEQVVRPTGLIDPEVIVRPASTQVDDLLSEIRRRVSRHERVLVTTLTKRMAEELTEYLAEHG